MDQHATCGALKAQLAAKGLGCGTDLGTATGKASYAGKKLADECCASCGGGSVAPTCSGGRGAQCDKCIVTLGATRSQCASYGLDCSCSKECKRSSQCAKCIADGFDMKRCAAVGFDCKCLGSSGAGAVGSRRRVFGVGAGGAAAAVSASVATNVDGSSAAASHPPLFL